jgi:hypothetical protein
MTPAKLRVAAVSLLLWMSASVDEIVVQVDSVTCALLAVLLPLSLQMLPQLLLPLLPLPLLLLLPQLPLPPRPDRSPTPSAPHIAPGPAPSILPALLRRVSASTSTAMPRPSLHQHQPQHTSTRNCERNVMHHEFTPVVNTNN